MEQNTPLGGFRPKNILTVPLMENQRATGVALLASTHRALHAEQTDQLEFLRTQGAPYLQTAVLHRKLRDLAAIDDLTQILNRRFGLRRLQEEFSRAVRHGTPVSVLLVDVDRFKSFNDTFGHEVGDEILKLVASNFEANLRSGDVVCRYGGEEFMVVAPGTGLQDAGILGERLRRMVATTELRWRDQALSVTVSLGVATWPMERVSVVEELIAAADKALYAAKQAGRNRTAAISGDLVQFYDSAG
jgi:diguanylate cyclase (GGDEF)-like protein